jgi:copper chaperone CopZ
MQFRCINTRAALRFAGLFSSPRVGHSYLSLTSTAAALVGRKLPILPQFHTTKARGAAALFSAITTKCSLADGAVELQIKVSGMVCDGCSGRVEETLKAAPGVKTASVDLEKGMATITVDAGNQVDALFSVCLKLCEAVNAIGFEAEPHFAEAKE